MPPATVTVTDHFQDGAGNPLAGRVIFRPSVTVKYTTATIPAAPIVAKLNGTGDLSVVLLANNGTGVTPQGWTYEVTLMVGPPGSHGDLGIDAWTREVWHISLPQTPSSVVLRDLTPVEAVRPSQFEVMSVSGVFPDIGGNVPLTAADLELSGVGFASKASVDAIDARVDALEVTPPNHASRHAPGGADDLSGSYLTVVQRGAVNGVASLDSGGLIPSAQLPPLALSEFLGAVASEAEMLALSGQRGDWATRTDTGTTWILTAEPSTLLASWKQVLTPADAVTSVAGKTGVVTLAIADVPLLQASLDDGANISPESATLGDFMASIPRWAASSSDTLSNQVLSLSGGVAMRSFSSTRFKFHVRGVVGSPGIVTFALFKGTNRSNLTKVVSDTTVTTLFGSTGPKEVTFSSLSVTKGEWVYPAFLHTNAGTDPSVSVLASAPSSDLLNPSSTQVICGFKTGQTSIPSSVDMTTGWTIYNRLIWFALAP